MTEFNFEEWAELSKTNPIEFERKRKAFLEAEIRKVPEDNRAALLSLQMQCDAIRAVHDDPVEAAGIMLDMAKNKLQEAKGQLTSLRSELEDIQEIYVKK